jgi:hypothetical protein
MSLEDKFLKINVDFSGAVAKDRFDYQIHYAMLLTFQKYRVNTDDFTIFFEYFDDISVYNKTKGKISAFQVKTKDGDSHWTETELTDEDFFPKLYNNVKNFGTDLETLHFVSNLDYKKGKGKKLEKCCKLALSEFLPANQDKIKKAIENKYKEPCDLHFFKVAILENTGLPLQNHADTIVGIIYGELKSLYPTANIDPGSFYECFNKYVTRQNNYHKNVKSLKKLTEKKGITREEFKNMIDAYGSEEYTNYRKDLDTTLSSNKVALDKRALIIESFDKNKSLFFSQNRQIFKYYQEMYDNIKSAIKSGKFTDEHSLCDNLSSLAYKKHLNHKQETFYALAFLAYKRNMEVKK